MDPTALQIIVDQSIILLTFFATKAVDVVGEKVIERGFEKGKQVYELIFHRFKKVPDQGRAVKVLENFKDDPEEYTINLRTHILNVLQTDPQFAAELRRFLGQNAVQEIIASGGSIVRGNKMTNTTGSGRQTIQADASQVEDNQMDIR